jgi:serine/threonine protein kinase
MNSDQWRRVETLYHAALERDFGARKTFLTETCSDEQVRLEVAALLRYDTQAKSFIESNAVGAAARALAVEVVSESAAPREIGPYRLLAPIGQGGMGEVHLAVDTRLNRKVAIKLLPSAFTADTERARRFKQEARASSALSHPNIVTVFEVGEIEGRHYIVSEFVEGQTLRQMIDSSRQGLELRSALAIAAQVAGALEAAHNLGIIHRDIKPENVIVRKDGLVKVLDFGLAKLNGQQSDDTDSQSQLLLTRTGVVMGTAAYMSPEQARGQRIDHRADIFSFGAMAYEMLSGKRPFEGATTSDVIAAVLIKDPEPLRNVAAAVTPTVSAIVGRCLEKESEKRFQSAADLAFSLQDLAALSTRPVGIIAKLNAALSTFLTTFFGRTQQLRKYWITAAVGAILLTAIAGWTIIKLLRPTTERPSVAFNFNLPDGWGFRRSDLPSVSPDGQMIVVSAFPSNYRIGQEGAQLRRVDSAARSSQNTDADQEGVLWLRRVDSADVRRLQSTEAGTAPFWSPDSRNVVFLQRDQLNRVDIASGTVKTLIQNVSSLTSAADGATFDLSTAGAGSWSVKNIILFSIGSKLVRLNDSGSAPIVLGRFADSETGQYNPRFLPDGKHFLYYSRNKNRQDDGVYVASVDTAGQRKLVLKSANAAQYVSGGYLLFSRDGQLLAQRFDLSNFEVTGDATGLGTRVDNQSASATFSSSENGVLVWRAASADNPPQQNTTQMTWFDRSGKRLGAISEPATYSGPAFSPDEKQLVVGQLDPKATGRDLWVFDVTSGTKSRFTSDGIDELNPAWSPDGRWIYFTAERNGKRSIFRKLANGLGNVESVTETSEEANLEDISADGRFLIFNSRTEREDEPDLTVLSLDTRRRITFSATKSREDHAQFSPNGHWVVYRSEETGRSAVFVRGLTRDGSPSPNKLQISDKGADQPRWSADGKELFYLEDNKLMVVDIDATGNAIEMGSPKPLFRMNLESTPRRNRYLISHDGQRILALSLAEAISGSTLSAQLNWPATLPK